MCFAFSNVVLNVVLHCVVSYLIAFHIFKYFVFNYDFAFKCCLVLNCLMSYLCLNNNIVSRFIYLCHVKLYLIFRIFIVFLLSCLLFYYYYYYFHLNFIYHVLFLYFIYHFLLLLLGSRPIFWPKSWPKLV